MKNLITSCLALALLVCLSCGSESSADKPSGNESALAGGAERTNESGGDECGDEGECGSGGDEHEAAALAKDDPAGTYGMGLTLTNATAIGDILANPEKYWDERVLIKGAAVGVCKKRGCWIVVRGEKENESLRVKVTDGEIVFPLSCLGNEVSVEGIFEKLELEVEGQDEPETSWRIRGLGAKI